MLDHFLVAAYNRKQEDMEKRATVDALKKLPPAFLMKLASGEVKFSSFLDSCAPKCGDDDNWLDRFRGTDLLDQAMALEEQGLSLEMQRLQNQQQRREESQQDNAIWDQQDNLRLQKKLLELQLYQLMLTGEHAAEAPMPTVDAQKKKPVPEAGTPGAGSMGPEAENSEENMAPVGTRGPGNSKTAMEMPPGNFFGKLKGMAAGTHGVDAAKKLKDAVKKPVQEVVAPASKKLASSPFGKLADSWGRELARSEFEKKALTMPNMGQLAGAGKAMLGGVKSMWGAMPAAQKSKMLGGAALGALGGAATQAHDQQGWHPMKALGGALGGAALGGAAGGVAHNIGAAGGVASGLQRTSNQARGIGQMLADKAQGLFPKG